MVDVAAVVEKLREAINDHDLDGLVNLFDSGLISEQPVHPARSFRGNEQVRRNWAQIFAAVSDLRAELVRSAVSGDTVWAEWDWSGTRAEGARHAMRGVTILRIEDGRICAVRFYMEPVERDGAGIDTAVRHHLAGR